MMDCKELIGLSKKAADEWRNDHTFYQAGALIDSLCSAIETLLVERDAAEKDRKIYRAALDKWGALMQSVVAIEELSELQKELCKSIRGNGLRSHIAEEIADVSIMLEQMTMLFSVQDAVPDWRKSKLERLERKVKEK